MDILFLAVSGLLTTYIPRQQCMASVGMTATTTTTTEGNSNGNPTTSTSSSSNVGDNDDKKKSPFSFPALSGSSIHNDNNKNSNSSSSNVLFSISLGLSLLLFTLNILEEFPQSWLFWITTTSTISDDTTTTATSNITDLYRIVLWTITIHCMLIIPSATGIQIALMIFHRNHDESTSNKSRSDSNTDTHSNYDRDGNTDDDDELKKREFVKRQSNKKRHWMVRILYSSGSLVTATILSKMTYYVVHPLHQMIQYYMIIPMQHRFQWCCFYRRKSLLPAISRRLHNNHNRPTNRLWCSNSMLIRCCYDSKVRKSALYGSTIGICVSALTLVFICPLVIEQQHDMKHGNRDLLLHCISCLCAVGIILSTILNGFGTISLPYTCIAGLFVEPIPLNAIINAEIELEQIKVNLDNKIHDFTAAATTNDTTSVLLGSANSKDVSPPKSSSSFWMMTTQKKRGNVRRNFSEFTNDATAQQRQKSKALLSDIEFLETLINDMTNNLEEMRYTQSISYDARTTIGKLRSYMGIFFSILLLSRLTAALSNVGRHYLFTGRITSSIWLQTTPTNEANIDPVTRIIIWLSGRQVATTESLRTISQSISLSLTAMLSISQIRVFVRTTTTLQRRLKNFYQKCYCQPFRFGRNDTGNVYNYNRNHKTKLSNSFTARTIASYMSSEKSEQSSTSNSSSRMENNTWFLSHPLSFLLCCYCLACIVLTKMMLPIEYRANFYNAILNLTPTSLKSNIHPMANTIFTIRSYTIDVLYTITALISGTIFAFTLSFMRSNVRRIHLYSKINNHNDSVVNRSPSIHTTSIETI